jgi:hypothetical protein
MQHAQQQYSDAQHEEVQYEIPIEEVPAVRQAVWMVWVEGGETVGPVSAHQLARGIRAGRVPPDASVQRQGDVFWSGILDEPMIIEALKEV